MSINGVLEDLPLADVLQFVHLGRRTGTLYMWQGEDARAEIGFHDGRIISAWTPGQRRLGDRLVASEVVSAGQLEEALAYQRSQGQGRSIGQILLDRGAVTRQQVYDVIKEQIQETIFDLVHWRHGYFQFEVDELNPYDDFGVSPQDLLDNLDLNTQMLVLEAARLFDEKNRARTDDVEPAKPSALDARLERAGLGRGGPEPRSAGGPGNGRPPAPQQPEIVLRCQVVSDDPALTRSLQQDLPSETAKVVAVPLRDAGTRVPGEGLSPLVVLDLRSGEMGLEAVATLARTRPAAPVVVVVDSAESESAAYEAGALSVVSPGRGTVLDCCRNLIRVFTQPQPHFGVSGMRGGVGHFRRVVFDVQSGLASTTMALNLMHLISDSVERAVLFLVREDHHLQAVGAFGFSMDGQPLAEATRSVELRPEADTPFARVIADAEPQILDFDDARLPERLAQLLGRPASGQVVLFPVLGAERTISVIYTDNGALEQEIEDVRILELATSQVGMAFENELLRQQMDGTEFQDIATDQ